MEKWIPAWRAVPIDYHQGIGRIEDLTQKACFRNNLSGERVRLRLTNRYSEEPLRIERACLALRNRVNGRRSVWQDITLSGEREITLAPGADCCSDELPISVTPEDDFLVELYFRGPLTLRCVCVSWSKQLWQSAHFPGELIQKPTVGPTLTKSLSPWLAGEAYDNQFLLGFCEIDVYNRDGASLLALFGDSVTHMGYYSDVLTEALYARFPGRVAVMNAGIGGNRIARSYPRVDMPGGGALFGEAGKERIVRDVFDGAQPERLFLLEGVNDCTHAFAFGEADIPTAEEIFGALKETAALAAAKGAEVCLSTIMPFGCFNEPWREKAEALRQQVNTLLRAAPSPARLVDLDAFLRDPEDHHLLQAGMDLGDGIHPGPAGGRKIAQAVEEALFPQDKKAP